MRRSRCQRDARDSTSRSRSRLRATSYSMIGLNDSITLAVTLSDGNAFQGEIASTKKRIGPQ